MLSLVRSFVRAGGQATVVCPSCNAAKTIKVDAYRDKQHIFKVRCQCHAVFTVQLEFRRHYRKQTDLGGLYTVINPIGAGGGIIHIKNLSRGGIGFTVSGIHPVLEGQRLLIEFSLNDRHASKVRKEALVRTVTGNTIGCQFDENEPLEKALGFYLQQ